MRLLNRINSAKGMVGIEDTPEGLAIAIRGPQHIDRMEMIADDDKASQLHHFIEKHGLKHYPTQFVLAKDKYQLLLVEAPDVPEEEMREAIRWRIKDLVSIPVDTAVLEIFLLPNDGNRSGKKMLYVVVVDRSVIVEITEMVSDAGLTLSSIDIPELVLRNLGLIKSGVEDTRGLAIARIYEGGGSVSLFRAGNLYLSRQFKLGYGGGLLDEIPADSLNLEIQRSLDYYERQMGLAPPHVLYLCGENVSEDKITMEIKRGLTVPAEYFCLRAELGVSDDIDDGMIQLCIGAIGSVYRDRVVTQ